MVTSAVRRLGCSNSVNRGFEKNNVGKIGGPVQKASHIQAFVLLNKLEMNFVPRRDAFQVFTPAPTGLVFEILGLHEGELAFSFEDAGVETVKEVAVAPFSGKLFGMVDAMDHHLEGDV